MSPQEHKASKHDLGAVLHPYDAFGHLRGLKSVAIVILGWFTITVEAFLRYDFGERYYSPGNVFIGFTIVSGVAFAGTIGALVSESGVNSWSLWLLISYLGFSFFHLWMIWVRRRTGRPYHSLFAGISHLELLGETLMKLLNPLLKAAVLFVSRFALKFEPRQELAASLQNDQVITNSNEFTKRFLEPLALLLLAWFLPGKVLSLYLFLCAVAVGVYSSMLFQEERRKELDLLDSFINANLARRDADAVRHRTQRQVSGHVEEIRERIKEDPQELEKLRRNHPTVADAMEALDDFFEDDEATVTPQSQTA